MNTYAFLIKAKAKSGGKNLFCWLSAKSDSRAQREIENILEDAEIEVGRGANYQLPIRTNWLVVDDLPAERVLDDAWCDRYELGDDGISWSKITKEAKSVNIQDERAQLEKTAGGNKSGLQERAASHQSYTFEQRVLGTRNSPLWVSKPDQQIAYLGVKYWARLYCPHVILGVYTPDEVEQHTEREINPAPQRVNLKEITGDTVATTSSARESTVNVDAIADKFRDRIDAAEDIDAAKAVGEDINQAKATLGSALFTELKNKATQRYHRVNARNKIEATINSLPQPGEPEAAERFAKAEQTLTAAKRHLGDELYEKFSINLLDMKPEYVG